METGREGNRLGSEVRKKEECGRETRYKDRRERNRKQKQR